MTEHAPGPSGDRYEQPGHPGPPGESPAPEPPGSASAAPESAASESPAPASAASESPGPESPAHGAPVPQASGPEPAAPQSPWARPVAGSAGQGTGALEPPASGAGESPWSGQYGGQPAGAPPVGGYAGPPMPSAQSGSAQPGSAQSGQPGGDQPPPGPGGEHPAWPDSAAAHPNLPHYQSQHPVRRGRRGPVGGAVIALLAGLVGGLIGGGLITGAHPAGTGALGAPNALDAPPPSLPRGPLTPGSVEQVAQKLLPSVVQLQFTGPSGSGEGSGVLLSADGMILTNNHVIEAGAQGAKLTAEFQDGRTAPVRIIGRAPTADLAVVQAQGLSGLTPAELGSSSGLIVGQAVVAIGSPFQLSGTVTSGIVSALQRPARVGGESGDQSTVLDTVQTDAPINPGNSGGPLVDMQGRVIAINSAIYSPNQGGLGTSQQGGSVGVGFAIPIDQARRIADQLRGTGKATMAVLNVTVRPNGAAQVVQVIAGGPGDKAGIKAGEVVVKVGDRRVKDGDALIAAIRSHAPGETVKLALTDASGGSAHTVDVVLGSQDVGTTH